MLKKFLTEEKILKFYRNKIKILQKTYSKNSNFPHYDPVYSLNFFLSTPNSLNKIFSLKCSDIYLHKFKRG
jgi:hypothetical protein